LDFVYYSLNGLFMPKFGSKIEVNVDFKIFRSCFDTLIETSKGNLEIWLRRVGGLGDVLFVSLVAKACKLQLKKLNPQLNLITGKKYVEFIKGLNLVDNVYLDGSKEPGQCYLNLQGVIDYKPVCTLGHRLNLIADYIGIDFNHVDTAYRIVVSDLEKHRAKQRLENLVGKRKIGIAPFAFAKVRTWNNWTHLVDKLNEKGFGVVLLHNKVVQTVARPDFLNLSGTLNLTELCAVLNELDAVVCVDSGILHIAGFLNVPFVGLFGTVKPDFRCRYYNQYRTICLAELPCVPCYDFSKCFNTPRYKECLNKITEEMVFKDVMKLLQKGDVH